MDLTTYTGLCAAVADYIARGDLTDQVQGFIRLAEVKFARVLRTVEMEVTTVLTTADDGTVALPADFQEMRSLNTGGFAGRDLDYFAPDVLAVRNGRGWTGDVYSYSTSGTTLQLAPAGSTSVTMIYSARFVPLSGANASNWLLANHPDAYLYGALAEYALFNDPANAAALDADGFDPRTAGVVSPIVKADTRKRWGSGRVVLQGAHP